MKSHVVPLPVIAFVVGFSLMVFELAAARILAPTIGSSMYVWTSVIGVIIAALSVGYWLGGKLADARAQSVDIAWLCLAAGFGVASVLLLSPQILSVASELIADRRLQGVLVSLLLFAPTSFVIGMIGPYLSKLNITSLETSGSSVAGINAFDSIGGIVGTFVAGFILFGLIGSRETFVLVVICLVVVSWAVAPRSMWKKRLAVSAAVVSVGLLAVAGHQQLLVDTPSASYLIRDIVMTDGRTIRTLASGPGGIQSAIYPSQPDELALWYVRETAAAIDQLESRQDILILGGGTFTLPRHLANEYPDSQIDVVEIDAGLADIAREYFAYDDPKNVQLIFDDARAYLNQTEKNYDIIYMDVYGDASTPFSLATKEFGDQVAGHLHPDGVVLANLLVGATPSCRQLFTVVDAPYRQQFEYQYYSKGPLTNGRGNVVAAYSHDPLSLTGYARSTATSSVVFDDNFAPIEPLQQACHAAA